MSDSITYASYIKVPELLALQQPLSDPMEHDELLFLVIHQVYELWFKVLLHEVDAVRDRLLVGEALPALKGLKRIHTIQRVLNQQVDVLETMTPVDFNLFRKLFSSASGFQSAQFRCLEITSGAISPRVLKAVADQPGMDDVTRRLQAPSLYEALLTYLVGQGSRLPAELLVPGGLREEDRPLSQPIIDAFREVYESAGKHGGRYESYLLLEHFVEYEELWITWRHRHVQMVERTIGTKPGSGGSAGAAYLRKSLVPRYFPELFAVRSELGT